jgi:alpha-beta hydrolase superfamily lysophospholipase
VIGDWKRLTVVAAACALLVGCSGDSEPQAAQSGSSASSQTPLASPSAVAFTDCADACEGEIDGAKYKILLPKEWNGTLLLYSHGYRSPVSVPPDYSPVTSKAEPSPGYSDGGVPLARNLLSKGYALAGSGWASNGWAVSDGVKANTDLYEFFATTVGKPERVYAWGDSLGGLVTMETAEKNPDWVSGAAPLCGVVGGVVPNFDLAMDVQYGIRELVDPDFQLTGYESAKAASQQLLSTGRKVLDAAASKKEQADILALALLADAKLQTQSQDGSTLDSQVQAAAEAALIGLRFGTVGRWDIEKRYGGNISDNTGTDYAARFSEEDRALLDEVGGAGTAKRIIASLEEGERVAADKAAVRAARKDGGEPSGTIEMPTLTLHTAADPLVAVQNQTLLREASGSTEDLVQLFTVAPDTYPAKPGAPYGAGHCSFTPESRVGMIDLLDQWVRGGQAPTDASVEQAFGADSGFDPTFEPGPWPQ